MEEVDHSLSGPCERLSLPSRQAPCELSLEYLTMGEVSCHRLVQVMKERQRLLCCFALHMEGVDTLQRERKSSQVFIEWYCVHRIKPGTRQSQD